MAPDPTSLAWLETRRWFGAKGLDARVVGVDELHRAEGFTCLGVTVALANQATQTYQIIVGPHGSELDDDPSLWNRIADAMGIDGNGDVAPMAVEQSNTSGVGRGVVIKVLRRLEPLHRESLLLSLLRDCPRVPRLRGHVHNGGVDLALAQEWVPDAVDGWQLALASVPRHDASWAAALGEALADVHQSLAWHRDAATRDGADLARALVDDLDRAIGTVPALAPLRPAIVARYEALDGLRVDLHHTHGDFHLGQTLHSPTGWHIVDFEGEPHSPPEIRSQQHPALRDLAGMRRSLDYARVTAAGPDSADGLFWMGAAWEGCMAGYFGQRGRPCSGEEQLILDAMVLARAVYEVTYEAMNRPSWMAIPYGALERLV